jgi:hypothetical protein
MAMDMYTNLLDFARADGTPVANTVTETAIFTPTAIRSYTLSEGRMVRLTAYGKHSTTGTPTLKFGVRWGGAAGVLLAETEPFTTGSGVTHLNWALECLIQCRASGATGSALAMGRAFLHTAAGTVLTNVFGVSGTDAPAVATIDTTVDKLLVVTATWGTANAANTLTGLLYTAQALN